MRLAETTSGSSVAISAFADPLTIVNMSGAQTAESFEDFVWEAVQERLDMRLGERPFIKDKQNFVLDEAKEPLEALNKHGNSDHALSAGRFCLR